MNKERKLQKKVGDKRSDITEQEEAIKELTRAITLTDFVNHAELRDLVSEAKAALDALEQDWAKAEEARDKLEKLQGKREEVK